MAKTGSFDHFGFEIGLCHFFLFCLFMQVDFPVQVTLLGVLTKGNPQAQEWVTKYTISFSNDVGFPTIWENYQQPYGTDMVFTGNSDNGTQQIVHFNSGIPARHVRLNPKEWNGYIALQVDFFISKSG